MTGMPSCLAFSSLLPGLIARQDIARHLRDRAGDLAAALLDQGLGLGPGSLGQRAGQDERLAGEGELAAAGLGRLGAARGSLPRPPGRRAAPGFRGPGNNRECWPRRSGRPRGSLRARRATSSRSWSSVLTRAAMISAIRVPTWRIVKPVSSRSSVRCLLASSACTRLSADFLPIRSSPARVGASSRYRSARLLTSFFSTSWSISFSPRPSMSMASRWAYQRSHSLSWSGQRDGGLVQ